MGTYTHVRGWIKLKDINFNKTQYEEIIVLAKDISPRSEQCISCTCFNTGFNFENYIFIGGEIKDYDNDWNIYLDFIFESFEISEYNLEIRCELEERWTKIDKPLNKLVKENERII